MQKAEKIQMKGNNTWEEYKQDILILILSQFRVRASFSHDSVKLCLKQECFSGVFSLDLSTAC